MSITQEQFDALKPGDQVQVNGDEKPRTVVANLGGAVWVQIPLYPVAQVEAIENIDAIISTTTEAVSWVADSSTYLPLQVTA